MRRGVAIISDDGGAHERAVLAAPAQGVSSDTINEMLTIGSGVLFVALSHKRADSFMLSTMSRPLTRQPPADEEALLDMCLSVEAREGITTGISASDRAITVRILGDPQPDVHSLITPGHIMPVRVRNGGVLVKNSLPEAAVDIVRSINRTDAAIFVDLLDQSGELLNSAAQVSVAERFNLPLLPLSTLIRHRLKHEQLVQRITEVRLPTRQAGNLRSYLYTSSIQSAEHLALVKGDISGDEPVLTRVQAGCTVGDVFSGGSSSSRRQIEQALNAIGRRGRGVLVYLRRPLKNNLSQQIMWHSSDKCMQANFQMRDYGLGAQILRDLGVKKVEVLTSSGRAYAGLDMFGIEITAQHPLTELL